MLIKDANGNEISQNPQVIKLGAGLSVSTDEEGTATLNQSKNIISAVSNGTTAVSVFGATGLPYAITIDAVWLIARDTTATNITVEAPASTTVCTIAKGVTAGAVIGATSLSNTSVPAGTNVIVDGSSTGVAQVFIQYSRA